MANLNGFDIGTNYKGIINLGTVGTPTAGINLPLTAVATGYKVVTDGMGNPSPLQLATDAVKVDSAFSVTTESSAQSFRITGLAGAGHMHMRFQSGDPTLTSSTTTVFYSDNSGNLRLKNGSNDFTTTFVSSANSQNSTYTLPNVGSTTLAGLSVTQSFTAAQTISVNGAASTPPASFTGTWFSGGNNTTTKPQLLIEPTGTTSTNWSTSGTGLGINAASSFTGNLIDSQINGVSKFSIDINGNVAGNIVYNRGISFRDTGAFISSDANNQIKVYTPGAAAGDTMFLQIGGNTVTYPALKRNGTNIDFRLANDNAFTGFTATSSILTVPNTTTTFVSGLSLTALTAATSGSIYQYSPALVLSANTWTGSASSTLGFSLRVRPTSGTVAEMVLGTIDGTEIGTFGTSSFSIAGNLFGSAGILAGSRSPIAASAILEARSTTKGFLPPVMTTAQKNAISSPATGLIVFDTDLGKLCVRTAGGWQTITSA